MKKIFFFFLPLFSFYKTSLAQNILYFDEYMNVVEKKKLATYQRIYSYNSDSTNISFEDYDIDRNNCTIWHHAKC